MVVSYCFKKDLVRQDFVLTVTNGFKLFRNSSRLVQYIIKKHQITFNGVGRLKKDISLKQMKCFTLASFYAFS